MSTSDRHSSKRETILAAGIELLREHGIAALTQPKVAAAAGVKQSHLTYYFPKRVDLLLAVAEHAIDQILNDLATASARNVSESAIVERMSSAMVEGVPPRVMLGLIVAADADPEIRPALQKLIRQVRDQIQLALAKAGMRADDRAALAFHAVVVGLAVMHDAQRTELSALEIKTGMEAIVKLIGA